MNTENKSFGIALALWVVFGGLGVHRIYIKETPITFLWYWLAAICTIGILPLVDLFLLKAMCLEKNQMRDKLR